MAESGFRAARAWVEVSTDLDASQIDRAARRAAEQVDGVLTSGMERTGDTMSRSLGRAGERGGENLIKSVGDKIKRDNGGMLRPALDGSTRMGVAAGNLFGGSLIKASAPVIAANAPTLGAALAGGISAGVATGTIGVGIALALQDPKVKEQATATGAFIGSTLKGAAEPFKAELTDAFAQGRSAFSRWAPELRGLFADAAPLMRPLTTGLEHMVDNLLPGIRAQVKAAEPPVNSLRLTFERLGDATGDMFTDLADDADTGATAIDDLALSMENLIRTTSLIAQGSAKLKEFTNSADAWIDRGRYWIEDNSYLADSLRKVGVNLDITADGFRKGTPEADAYRRATMGTAEAADFARLKQAGMTDAQITGIDASGRYRGEMIKTANGLNAVRGEANNAALSTRTLGQIMDDFAGRTLDAESATIRMEQAIDDATASVKANGKGIDANNPKQRENRSALLGIAAASREASAKILAQTGSQEKASAATERGRKKFLEVASAMGVSSGKARELADRLFGIPAERKPKVTVQDAQALAALRAIKSGIATVRDKTVTVTVKWETRGNAQGEHTIGQGTQLKNRLGGAYVHAASGALRDPGIFPASVATPARYAFAEPETGGEAFIPKRTPDRARALSILETAAGWHGATLSPRSSGGSGGDQHFHFAAGSIVLDASKIRDVADLANMVRSLTPAARSMIRRGASVGSRA